MSRPPDDHDSSCMMIGPITAPGGLARPVQCRAPSAEASNLCSDKAVLRSNDSLFPLCNLQTAPSNRCCERFPRSARGSRLPSAYLTVLILSELGRAGIQLHPTPVFPKIVHDQYVYSGSDIGMHSAVFARCIRRSPRFCLQCRCTLRCGLRLRSHNKANPHYGTLPTG
ncbi:hypothetical protein EDD16DRAFT_1189118 [Pisolithus croceorrhizus]|nr:hypothetical protein EDD16DRAFT_1189118 [Pisolithus croceorrhizus]KAI6160941.1 hypothetical protein EDD17DRAFT_720923 [Pisolithus thermaeus]